AWLSYSQAIFFELRTSFTSFAYLWPLISPHFSMHQFYTLVAGLFLLCSTSVPAQEQTSSPVTEGKYTSINLGPSLTTLSPKGEPWLGRQFGAHAGVTYLTMQNNWLGIQAEAQ